MTCDPSIYTLDHPDLIACGFKENSIGLKRAYNGKTSSFTGLLSMTECHTIPPLEVCALIACQHRASSIIQL